MDNSKITDAEKEILDLITNEFLTVNQIALSRHCSIQAVYKIIKSLKNKGLMSKGLMKVEKSRVAIQPNQIRIHNQQFDINILYKTESYKKTLKNCSQLYLDNNTVLLYENKIEVFSNNSFFGNDIRQALSKSISYWDKFFNKLEHEVSVIIKKPRSQNIKLVRVHYAETNNEISKEIDNKGEKYLQVYTTDDGKLWFLIDNSFNLYELETVHSKTAKNDMEKVKANFNDWRDNDHYLPSDTKSMLDKLAKISENVVKQQSQSLLIEQQYAENMKTHVKVMKEMQVSFKKFNSLLTERQKKLGDFFGS